VHEKISTAEARSAHINELLPWSEDVSGLDIDYEGVRREDGEAYALFIEDLAKRLHAEGKRLSVTVEPKTDANPGDGGKALDWKRIGAAADQVRVMAYFFHSPGGSPGAIAPLDWLSRLAQFAKSQVPAEKLVIVLTVNGIDWPVGQRGRPIRFHTVASLIAYENAKPQRDAVDQTPFLRYSSGKEKHEVWYEDAASLQAKVDRLRKEGIQAVGFWMLGAGDPVFWGRLGALKK
jgi:spore germination protein